MSRRLLDEPHSAAHIVLTGATGYLGALTAVTLLLGTEAKISCLVRSSHDDNSLFGPIIEEWEAQGQRWTPEIQARIRRVVLPSEAADTPALAGELAGADEIVHCAGHLDYYNVELLEAVNIGFTRHMLALGKRLDVKRFVYVSTAFAAGYSSDMTPEAGLAEPPADPTHYTRTKREAELAVAASGLPFVVVRPSILIGTGKTGRYSGKRYGLYQQWMGLERLTCDRFHPEFHTVAPKLPLNLLHQDAYGQTFLSIYRWVPSGSYVNQVSKETTSPSMRHLWDMWFETTRPRVVYYYDRMDDVPLASIPSRQRAYLTFAQINLEISSHHWRFETGWLDALRAHRGLAYQDATIDSVRTCQKRFVSVSEVMAKYFAKHRDAMATKPEWIECSEPRSAHGDGALEVN